MEVKANIHNRFDIFSENIATGEKKQIGYAENIILDKMWDRLCTGSTYFSHIHYGDGVLGGVNELKSSNTQLFNQLAAVAATTDVQVYGTPDSPTSYWRRYIVLGLDVANNKELSEVGIGFSTTKTDLVTQAMIRDMNGNVTTLLKTNLDVVTIYATVYFTLINDHASLKMVHPAYNGLIAYLMGGSFPAASFAGGNNPSLFQWHVHAIRGLSFGSKTGSWINDIDNKKRKTSKIRFDVNEVNGNSIAEIGFSNIARLTLPASGIYSGLSLSGVPVGTGDDIEEEFDIISNPIDKSTCVIKINNVINTDNMIMQADRYLGKISYFGGGPPNDASGVAFSHDSKYMAVASTSTPYLTLYELVGNVYTKISYSGGDPAANAYGVAFSHDSKYLAVVSYKSGANLTLYELVKNYSSKVKFDTPPADGAVITADYTVKGIHKTSQRVIDLEAEIQFGEPEEEEEE